MARYSVERKLSYAELLVGDVDISISVSFRFSVTGRLASWSTNRSVSYDSATPLCSLFSFVRSCYPVSLLRPVRSHLCPVMSCHPV